MSYQPAIPTGSVPLNQDYLNIQGNFTSLNNQFNVDHVPLTSTSGSPPNGYHTALHLAPQASVAAVAGYGELFCQTTNDGISTSQQLFYQFVNATPTTINVPLTRNLAPKLASNGYTFLPGGLILQWGSIAATNTNPAVVFTSAGNINFPNAIYNIQVTRQHAPASPGSNSMWVSTTGLTTSGFTIINDDGHTWSYNWIAIGN